MADTIREILISAIVDFAENVRKKNGYQTDIGHQVLRAYKYIDESFLPCISIWPLSEDCEHLHGRHHLTMALRVEANSFFYDEMPSTVSERMLGDIIYMMANPSKLKTQIVLTDKLVDSLDVLYQTGGPEEYPEPGDKIVGVSAIFAIKYRTNKGDPYNQ